MSRGASVASPVQRDGAWATRIWPFYSADAVARVTARVGRGDLSATGHDPEVVEVEGRLRSLLLPEHRFAFVGSGTSALASAYFALRLRPGAEVLVPSHTFRATATAMLPLGLTPVLCDTDSATGCVDLADAARRVSPRTEALVVTHVWGRPVPLDEARRLADAHGLALVEDCSHAHGTRWRDRPVGSAGDIAVFSLGTTKLVSGGTAGALATRDDMLFERALSWGQPKHRVLRQVGDPALRALAETGLGNNLRAIPLAAILAGDHLDRLADTVRIRNDNLDHLRSLLAEALPPLEPLPVPADRSSGTLYKFHGRWLGDPARFAELVSVLRRIGLRVREPAPALHTAPAFTDPDVLRSAGVRVGRTDPPDPDSFPGTDSFLQSLVEFDTRDLYEPADQAMAWWAGELARAGQHLR